MLVNAVNIMLTCYGNVVRQWCFFDDTLLDYGAIEFCGVNGVGFKLWYGV